MEDDSGRVSSAGSPPASAAVTTGEAGSKAPDDSRSAWSPLPSAGAPSRSSLAAARAVASSVSSSVRSISRTSSDCLASRSVTAPRPDGRWPSSPEVDP